MRAGASRWGGWLVYSLLAAALGGSWYGLLWILPGTHSLAVRPSLAGIAPGPLSMAATCCVTSALVATVLYRPIARATSLGRRLLVAAIGVALLAGALLGLIVAAGTGPFSLLLGYGCICALRSVQKRLLPERGAAECSG